MNVTCVEHHNVHILYCIVLHVTNSVEVFNMHIHTHTHTHTHTHITLLQLIKVY